MLFFLVYLSLCSITLSAPLSTTTGGEKDDYIKCTQDGDCVSNSLHCQEICGCDGLFIFNYTINECELNFDYVKQLMVEKHNTADKIRLEAEKVFNGIIVATLFFITCAGLCALTACIYCCRINYTDQKLTNDVKALEDKLKRDNIQVGDPKRASKKYPKPSTESCTIVDADAGVFVC